MSTDPQYKDGEKIIFMNVDLINYKYAEGFWPDHFVMTTQTGKHFFLAARDQDASVV